MEEIIQKCLPTYHVVDKLGEGVYGSVFRIQDPFKERAAKVVPILAERSITLRTPDELDSKISRDFHSVRTYYEAIKGRGVIDIFDFHLVDKQVSRHNAKAYLVILMALYPENLQDHVLDHFPIAPSRGHELMNQLASILSRLAQPGQSVFLVTDLKPSNLLLDAQGNLLIGDLGGLKRISSMSTIAGSQFSPSWCAPEIIIKGERPQIPAAIYSYGLVSYFLWEGRLPYEGRDFSQRPRMIRDNGITFTHGGVPKAIRELIRHCLAFDPAQRPVDFGAIQAGLANPSAIAAQPSPAGDPGVRTVPYASSKKLPRHRIKTSGERTRTSTWTDPVSGVVFVQVTGGRFKMGCIEGDADAGRNERPSHTVDIDDYWIGKFAVTQVQWMSIMGENPSHFQKGDDYPVDQISWNDAVTFIKKLSGRGDGKFVFRLPTEAQWEFAARSGGRPERYAGSEDAESVAWHKDNSDFSSHPVGKKAPNGLGLYDMSGNVMEWCADVYGEGGYNRSRGSGASWESGNSDTGLKRVCRGGSWAHGPHQCRTTARRGVPAGLRYTSLGFRLVRSDG